MAISMRSATLA